MLKLSDLRKERLRVTVKIQEEEVTFGLRGPDHLELIEVSRAATVTRDKMLAAKAENRSYSASSEEMIVTIDGLSELVTSVKGLAKEQQKGHDEELHGMREKSWDELDQLERRQLLAAIPLHQFWNLYNDVMSLDSLKADEKNG